jgi:hypothetical protein
MVFVSTKLDPGTTCPGISVKFCTCSITPFCILQQIIFLSLGYPPGIMEIFLSPFDTKHISEDGTDCADHEYHLFFRFDKQ